MRPDEYPGQMRRAKIFGYPGKRNGFSLHPSVSGCIELVVGGAAKYKRSIPMAKFVRYSGPRGVQYGRTDGFGTVEALTGPAWIGGQPTGDTFDIREIRLLAPCEPSKIVCVAHNFPGHARERKTKDPRMPLIFLKPPSAVIGTGEAIVLPRAAKRVEHEAELGIVIGRRCHRVTAAYARGFGSGVTCVNDVTARDIQEEEGGYYLRAKAFDTFCPIGPWIEEGPVDINATNIRCLVNGEIRQQGRGDQMLFDPWQIVSYVSSIMTLLPGDIVVTGTPSGVGQLEAGDTCDIEIDGVGRLRNPVVQEA
jgi:2-keto-4-pentenoate hydratase/2-oxohepta-3-ene-1,7-dioic acid hydratase in catechol pathway